MGKSQRDKGVRFERKIVGLLNEQGITAKRVPLSGATWMKGDVLIGENEDVAELKCRGNGFKTFYQWLLKTKYLIIGADRMEPLIVMRLKDWGMEKGGRVMMAVLFFDLPEDEVNFKIASSAMDWAFCLWDFDQWLRGQIKHQDKDYDAVRSALFEIMETHNISFEMIG